MADAIAAVVNWVSTAFSAASSAIANVLASVGVNAAAAAAIGDAAVKLAISYGASQILGNVGRQDLPPPELGQYSTKQPIPERIRAFGRTRLSGPYMLYAAKDGYSHDVIALHDGKISAFVQFYLNDNPVTLSGTQVQSPDGKAYGSGSNLVWIESRVGLATETAYTLSPAISDLWDSSCRGDGIASIYLKCKMGNPSYFTSDYPDGLPIASAVCDTQLVYDWRTDTTVFSENPIVCLASYICNDLGFDFDAVIAPNLTKWTAAANACDASRGTPDDTEAAFRIGGKYFVTNSASSVIGTILQSCGGFLCEDGRGGLVAYAGVWEDPAVTIDDSLDAIYAYAFQRGSEAEQSFNAFDISYVNPAEGYITGDAGRWRNEALITEAGEVRATSLEMPWVPSPWQAQRAAKIHDKKTNPRLSGYIIGGLSLIQCYGEMIVGLNISDCDALNGIAIMPVKIEIIDLLAGRVRVTFIEVSEETFAFDTDTEYLELDAAPSGGTGSNEIEAPSLVSYTVQYDETSPDVFQPRAIIRLLDSERTDIRYQIRYRVTTSDSWTEMPVVDALTDIFGQQRFATGYLPDVASLYIQIRAIYGSGTSSTAWGATETLNLAIGDTAPAAPPSAYSYKLNSTTVVVGWDVPSDPNYYGGQVYKNNSSDPVTSTAIGPLNTGEGAASVSPGVGTWYFWVASENSFGTSSSKTFAGSVTLP